MQKTQHKSFTTISDVANYAEVGKTSVSRYLNGEQDKLSEALRAKIAQAITDLDYRPNHSARMLRAGQSKLIGLLLADVTNPYSIDVLKGIEHVCRREGYMLMVCNTDNKDDLQDRYLSLLQAHRVDGIIVNTAGMAQKQINRLKQLSCPLVLVDRVHSSLGFDSVGLDNETAAKTACEHLQAHDYESILVVTESVSIEPRQARVSTIQTFAKQNHLSCELVEIEKPCVDLLTQTIKAFIQAHPHRKKALFTTNGIAMMSTAKALKQLDIQVGSQLGLIGIDDPEWAQLFEGGITVMRQPTQQIGQAACERLLTRIQGNNEPTQHIKLKAELIQRHSL